MKPFIGFRLNYQRRQGSSYQLPDLSIIVTELKLYFGYIQKITFFYH